MFLELHYFATLSLSEVESRTQGSRPRPRTQKKFDAKPKERPSENRPYRGQGQECSRPRTKDTAAKDLQKIFFRRSQKKVFKKKNFASARVT